MITYIAVSFILGIFGIVLNLVTLANPDKFLKKPTIGGRVFAILVGTGFTIWAGFLLAGGS